MTTHETNIVSDTARVYVDTNVMHYLGAGPPDEANAKNALDALTTRITSGGVVCVTSDIALVEEYDTYKGRAFYRRELKRGNINWRNRALTFKRIQEVGPLSTRMRYEAIKAARVSIESTLVRLDNPTEWPSELVEVICRSTDLHWSDALHLAMSLALRCDIILTNDGEFYDDMVKNLIVPKATLHRRIADVLSVTAGLTEERLQAPIIEPVLLRDGSSASKIRAW